MHPSDFRYRDLLAGCYLNTGNLPDDYVERLKWYDQAVECYEELIEQDPPGLDYQRSLTNTLVNIANCQKQQGRIQAAIKTWQRLIEIREEYVKFAEEEPEFTSNRKTLAASMQSLAKLLKDEGDLEQAIRYRQKAITVRRAVAERFPERTLDKLRLFDDLKKLAELLSVAGHAKEAEAAYRDALAVWDATGDELAADMTDPAARLSVHMRLASYLVECPLVELRDTNRAVELATKATELWPDEPGAWGTLGICHYRAGNWKRANDSVEKSLELLSGMSRPYPIGYSYNWLCLALTHWQLGKKEEAYRWYDKANDLISQNPTEDEDLKRWHAEVTEMLGIAEKPENQKGATETPGEKDTHASEGSAENPEKQQHLAEED